MTDWDQMVEYIHNAMQAVSEAHQAGEKLRADPKQESFNAFRAQMDELSDHLKVLKNALEHEDEYIWEEIDDRLMEALTGRPSPYRKTRRV